MIALAIRIGLLLCSTLGYIGWLYKKGIEIALAPILVSAGIGLAMFAAGILNAMPETVLLLFAVGFLLFAQLTYAILRKHISLARHEWIVLAFFISSLLFMALRLRSAVILEIDNFSHWLTVVKDMVRSNQMPNFNSFMVGFKSYPTGTAGFIYYIAKIVGEFEGVYLFAQSFLYVSCLTCFWAFAKSKPFLSALFIYPVSAFLLVNNNPLNSLCVDTMLSLLGIAGFSALVYYHQNLKLASICNCILSSFVMVVKNSGIFFVIIHFVLLLAFYLRSKPQSTPPRRKSVCTLTAANLGLPLLLFYIWNRHVDYVFVNGRTASHSMNLDRFSMVLEEKTGDVPLAILSAFWNWMRSIDSSKRIVLLILAIFLAAYLVKRFLFHTDAHRDRDYFIYGVFSWAVYLAGLLAMYFVSMTGVESLHLAAIERYFKTFVMYLLGISILYILQDFDCSDSASILRRGAGCLLLFFALSTTWTNLPFLFRDTIDYSQKPRCIFQDILAEYGIMEGTGCYILYDGDIGGEAVGCMRFVTRYELWSWGNVYVEDDPVDRINNQHEIINDYDYLIVMYENEAVDQFLTSFGLTPGQRAYHLAPLRES